jgi:hypothetical protein
MISSDKLTFGSDPEVATYYTTESGIKCIEPPAYFRKYLGVDYVPDDKHPVFIQDSQITVMEDGCAFEYTLPAVTTASDMFDCITRANLLLSNWLAKHGYELYITPAIPYEVEKWINEDDEFKRCLVFGCDPDRDAIEDDYICRTINALKHPWRYCGAHLHTGSNDPEVVALLHKLWRPFVRLMAVLVGNTGIANAKDIEFEQLRGKMYGRPGRYRLPKWGIEYRTLSNSWITSLDTLEKIIEKTRLAFELVQFPNKTSQLLDEYLWSTCHAIATCNSELSQEILDNVEKEL